MIDVKPRDIQREELEDILYMYEQTFIDLDWEFQQDINHMQIGFINGFAGLCYMLTLMFNNSLISSNKYDAAEEYIAYYSNSGFFLSPSLRKSVFYLIKDELLKQ